MRFIKLLFVGIIIWIIKRKVKNKKTRESSEMLRKKNQEKEEKKEQVRIAQLKDAIKLANNSYSSEKEKIGRGIKEIEYSPEYAIQLKGEKVYFLKNISRYENTGKLFVENRETEYNGEIINWKGIHMVDNIISRESVLAITENRILILGASSEGFTYDLDSLEYIEKGITSNYKSVRQELVMVNYPGIVLAFTNKVNGKLSQHVIYGENAHRVAACLEDILSK